MNSALIIAVGLAMLFLGLAFAGFALWYREREQVTWLRARLAEATPPPITPLRPVAMQQDKQHGGVR